jgi:hypothetical protein
LDSFWLSFLIYKTTIKLLLFRTPNESEPLPSELKEPIGVANDLLNPPPPVGDPAVVAVGSQSGVLEESNSVSEDGEETLGKVSGATGFFYYKDLIINKTSAQVGDSSSY